MNLKGDSMSDFLLGMVLGIVIGLAIGKKQKPWSELTEEEKKTQKLKALVRVDRRREKNSKIIISFSILHSTTWSSCFCTLLILPPS
jgi:hypothetical protein